MQSLDITTGFDVSDPAAWDAVNGVDFAFLNAGVGGSGDDLDGYRRMVGVNVDGVVFGVRRMEQTMVARRLDRRHGLAGRAHADAGGSDLHAHEARRRRLRARDGAASRRARHPHQRDLPGVRRHADRDGRAARSGSRAKGIPLDAARRRSPRPCSWPRAPRRRGRRGSCNPAGSRCATSSAGCRGRDERLPHARRALCRDRGLPVRATVRRPGRAADALRRRGRGRSRALPPRRADLVVPVPEDDPRPVARRRGSSRPTTSASAARTSQPIAAGTRSTGTTARSSASSRRSSSSG